MISATKKAYIGRGGFGHVADIPFPDCTFDIVAGIQSFEHWDEPLPDASMEIGHAAGLRDIHRVLKPNGSIYVCAPLYLHGHEMFIAGDVQRIRSLFEPHKWKNVIIEKWRENYSPLERYQTPASDRKLWDASVVSYSRELLDDILANRSVALITITADKAKRNSL